MANSETIYLWADGRHITDRDRHRAFMLTMQTGLPVVVNVIPRWWEFWKPGWLR